MFFMHGWHRALWVCTCACCVHQTLRCAQNSVHNSDAQLEHEDSHKWWKRGNVLAKQISLLFYLSLPLSLYILQSLFLSTYLSLSLSIYLSFSLSTNSFALYMYRKVNRWDFQRITVQRAGNARKHLWLEVRELCDKKKCTILKMTGRGVMSKKSTVLYKIAKQKMVLMNPWSRW